MAKNFRPFTLFYKGKEPASVDVIQEAPTELFMQEIITWWRTSDGFKKIQVTKRFSVNSETTSIITQPFRLN